MSLFYTSVQTDQLRQQIIDETVVPVVTTVFQDYSQLQSATLLVAQYWSDNALDEVHASIYYSVLKYPDLEMMKQGLNWGEDPVNRSISLCAELYKLTYPLSTPSFNLISAFAAFCQEGSHQDMEYGEIYTPYAIFQRREQSLEVKIIGEMARPWLDGVTPDYWDI